LIAIIRAGNAHLARQCLTSAFNQLGTAPGARLYGEPLMEVAHTWASQTRYAFGDHSLPQTSSAGCTNVTPLTGPPIGLRYGHIFNPYLCRAKLSARVRRAPSASPAHARASCDLAAVWNLF
jgi:hypothetical protein